VELLISGEMKTSDAEAFKRWRAKSPAHEAAFAEAIRYQRLVSKAIHARRATSATPAPFVPARRGAAVGRRAVLASGGGLAAAAAATCAIVRPPAALWPSLAELMSDYRTGTGQRRDLVPAAGVSVALNTQTAVSLRGFDSASPGLRLVSGEAGLTVDRLDRSTFVVAAGAGRTLAQRASFDVRHDGDEVCVTCFDGLVDVEHPEGKRRLTAGEDLRYAHGRLGAPTPADTTSAGAWRRGLLIFRKTPLHQVVDELNRYRPGRIVLLDGPLGRRPVYAVFKIQDLGGAVEQIRQLTGAQETALPGGLVVLG
jgi:transmembrane sensor